MIQRRNDMESALISVLTNTMRRDISLEFLTRMMEGTPIERVNVSVVDGEFGYVF